MCSVEVRGERKWGEVRGFEVRGLGEREEVRGKRGEGE
jgi:hypothetical protein